MTHRGPGMDHALYPFSPLPARPPLVWPDGATLAVGLIVHLEVWEDDPPMGSFADPRFVDPYGAFKPDQRTWAWREYGLRIGIFRMFDVLDRYGLRATLAANAAALDRCPEVTQEAMNRRWEVAAHGSYGTRMISSAMTEAEERSAIAAASDAVLAATGRRPAGWVGQDFGESTRTPQLLAEAGFRWLADWPNDEQPYPMTTVPPILSVPVQSEWDDVQMLWHRRVPTQRYPAILADGLDVLRLDGARAGRSAVIGLHPWLMGMPHRIRYLDAALAALAQMQGVWHATLGEVAAYFESRSGIGQRS
jgi:peptidoglycan/xylan/chitin deacetylase (PgdA/CDA1 family)